MGSYFSKPCNSQCSVAVSKHTQAAGVLQPSWPGGYLYDSIIFPQQEEAEGSQLWVLVWLTICMRGYGIYKICNRWAGKHICYITVEVLGITFLLNKEKIFKMQYCYCPRLGIHPSSILACLLGALDWLWAGSFSDHLLWWDLILFKKNWSEYLSHASPSILWDTSRLHLYSVHHELNRLLVSQCQKCLQGMGFITSYWRNLTTASLSSSASREGAWVYLCHRNITGMNDWNSPFDRQSFCKSHCFSISVKNKEVKAFLFSSQPFGVLI